MFSRIRAFTSHAIRSPRSAKVYRRPATGTFKYTGHSASIRIPYNTISKVTLIYPNDDVIIIRRKNVLTTKKQFPFIKKSDDWDYIMTEYRSVDNIDTLDDSITCENCGRIRCSRDRDDINTTPDEDSS